MSDFNETMDLGLQNSVIQKNEYKIIDTIGTNGWFTDNIVSGTFEILSQVAKCDGYRIALANTTDTKGCYRLGKDPKFPDHEPGVPDPHPYGPGLKKYFTWKHVQPLLTDKDFIFLPINDGYATVDVDRSDNKKDTEKIAGVHWSLLVFDGRVKNNSSFRYYDSLGGHNSSNFNVANLVAEGLLQFLHDCVDKEYAWHSNIIEIDMHVPHQRADNFCTEVVRDAGSACGPYLWAVTKELVLYIIECSEDGFDIPINGLCFTPEFKKVCRWDSVTIRHNVKKCVAYAKDEQASRLESLKVVWPESG